MRLARTIRVVQGAKCSFSKLQDGLIDPSSVQHSGTVMGSFLSPPHLLATAQGFCRIFINKGHIICVCV